jgi:DNA topoisomerase-1
VARKRVESTDTSPKKAKKPAAKAKAASKSEEASTGAASSARAARSGATRDLVIVESPKKAKSINKFLGSAFVVKASMGHVRDLPTRKLGIDVEHGFEPTYEIMSDKKDTIEDLRKEADRARTVYMATDPDREGEAIAWHLQAALELPDDRVRRVMFYEITEKAVKEAFNHATDINHEKVNAQQARRILDRVVGYEVSPLLWKKVFRGLSAGRVQSVAVRLIAEREKEIAAFVSEEYWKITATLSTNEAVAKRVAEELSKSKAKADDDTPFDEDDDEPAADQPKQKYVLPEFAFEALLTQWKGKSLKFGGGAEDESISSEEKAQSIIKILETAAWSVESVDQEDRNDRPDAPFKTSTLQQQAAIRLRWSGKRTMKVAQELYEGIDVGGDGPVGLITYMRTDSLRVSDDALKAVREMIGSKYGPNYLPAKPNSYAAGKLAQEAHEAIRPTELKYDPDKIKSALSVDQYKLYSLIYKRFVASQMTPAIFAFTNVKVKAADGIFSAQGKILKFDGYRKVLASAGRQEDAVLPDLAAGQKLHKARVAPSQHRTQPPPRFSEATLIKALEKESIGRPSTYAPIIETIQAKKYVEQKERRFHATNLGMVVTDLLVKHFPKIMDVKFTAKMEDDLDRIAENEANMTSILEDFYGPFHETLKVAEQQMERAALPSDVKCPDCGAPMQIKFSSKGDFLGCSRYPECKATQPLSGERKKAELTEFSCGKCGKPLLKRENKRGEYLACSGYPDCKEIYNIGADGQPVPAAQETEYSCDKCGKPMILRTSARGPFFGCSGYPKCRNLLPADDQGRPIRPVVVNFPCPKCSGPMTIKQGKRGSFLGCANYPKCRGTAQITDEMKEANPELAVTPPAAKKGPDLKSVKPEEKCPECEGDMTVRAGRRGYFLGCAKYPKCKGTKEPGPITLSRIQAAVDEAEAAPSESAE